MSDLRARLCLNQITTEQWSLSEAVKGCVRFSIPWIGLWRHKVAATGLAESARIVRDAGLRVSSLCRGGMFPAATTSERQHRIDDNLRAIDEAAALDTDLLVLVNGPAPDCDIDAARHVIAEGIAAILPHAVECGVRLGVEPLHPMFAAERSVIVTLAEANRLADSLRSDYVGVVVDVYHVWWDPNLYRELARTRVVGFHVSDWPRVLGEPAMSRFMMGEGVIELRRIRAAVEATGYRGPIEVEIFNRELWSQPGDQVVEKLKQAYLEHV